MNCVSFKWTELKWFVIICILLTPARTSGQKQNVYHDKSPMSDIFIYSNVHDMTNSTVEIPEVGAQLPEWKATMHLYVWQYVPLWGNSCTSYLLTPHWLKLRVLSEEH